MAEFLMLLRDDPKQFAKLSPSEMQAIVERYGAWAGRLAQQGRLVAGKKLRDDGGRAVRRAGSQAVMSDGPYAEAKDVVGGFFIITAATYDEAKALVADCPHLDYGWVELREVEPGP